MKRRSFIKSIPLLGAAVVATPAILAPEKKIHDNLKLVINDKWTIIEPSEDISFESNCVLRIHPSGFNAKLEKWNGHEWEIIDLNWDGSSYLVKNTKDTEYRVSFNTPFA